MSSCNQFPSNWAVPGEHTSGAAHISKYGIFLFQNEPEARDCADRETNLTIFQTGLQQPVGDIIMTPPIFTVNSPSACVPWFSVTRTVQFPRGQETSVGGEGLILAQQHWLHIALSDRLKVAAISASQSKEMLISQHGCCCDPPAISNNTLHNYYFFNAP